MSTLATTLGLRAASPNIQPGNLAGYYMIFHFLFAYAGLSSRPWKQYYRIDHNVSPREDLSKYGESAISKGKLTQKQLNQMKRVEGAHANSVEHYTVFIGAMLWATITRLPDTTINASALVYTLARFTYAVSYIFVDEVKLSQLRGIAWWVSNITCLRLFWLGAKAINGSQ